MKLFWLSQNGENPTGPLLISQLKALAHKGQLKAEDQVCEDGSEDWQPVTALLGELPANAAPAPALDRFRPAAGPLQEGWMLEDQPSEKKKSDWMLWVIAAVLALGTAAGSWAYFFPEHHESVALVPTTRLLNSKVREYIQEHVPSGEVRVDDVGPAMLWSDGELRMVHYLAGGSAQTMVVRFNLRSQQVSKSWSPEDWMEQFAKTPDAEQYPGTVRIISDAAKTPEPGN